MNDSTPRSRAVRSRATRRLRTLTIGTTLAGFAASAGFAWLAAATYDGTGANVATVDGSTTIASGPSAGAPSTTSGSMGSSSSSSSSGVTRSSGRAQVSTGGS